MFRPYLRLLPRRTHWFLAERSTLSRRERRRLSRRPERSYYQREWEVAAMERLNAVIKRVYGESIIDIRPRDRELVKTYICDPFYPIRK